MRRRATLVLGSALLGLALQIPAAAQTLPPGNGPDSPDATILEPDPVPFTQERLAQLAVPEGFEITTFATDVGNARMLHVRGDGSVYVTRRQSGDLLLLRDGDGDGVAEDRRVVASNLPLLHGIAERDGTLYLLGGTQLRTSEIQADGTLGPLALLVDDLPDAGQHSARTMAFGPDGFLYVTIGSTCNNCEEANPENATIVRMLPDGSARGVYAKGLRHTIGFGWHPTSGQLWGMDHGSDWRGDDQPPEELNRIVGGDDHGWPWCFADGAPDPFTVGHPPGATKTTFCPTTARPALTYTAHAAPIGMAFYDADAFPADHRGDAFVAMRGSWNRSKPSGYEVVRVDFDDAGAPVSMTPFATGWLLEGQGQDGRPAQFGRLSGVAVWTDGSLLVGEDQNGVVYRISALGES